ncbi:hypothetical protein PHMEG_00014030 [Phytophthora megakarya]|uniref:Ubiquitin-like protease family profile domain-containing protein n=1 Tax=Phytophthora megakarya TaxID=4795 RepID=A0A225W5B7_9STRA|nr:hypothetical protein PHMEG_00014030 [Phytophthora megakarya]
MLKSKAVALARTQHANQWRVIHVLEVHTDSEAMTAMRKMAGDFQGAYPSIMAMVLMKLLELAGRGYFSDAAFETLLGKLFRDANTVFIKPSSLSVVVHGVVSINKDNLGSLFFGLSSEKVLLPINCNGVHWCCVMINLAKSEVFLYDPMGSLFLENIRDVAKIITPLLPPPIINLAKTRLYESPLGFQCDTYNCGLKVMLALEMFCGAR